MDSSITKAAQIIKNGGLVAFPTETVYGLGANAFNASAVERVYKAKGRPGDNPLILHVGKKEDIENLAQNPPGYVTELIQTFWPGPLTIVVNKKQGLPTWLGGFPTAQTKTIGIRMPASDIALKIINASGCCIAAPSANKAGTPSPTTAAHVKDDFNEHEIDMILDGGSVKVGLESTVLDVTEPTPIILRHGAITAEMIEAVIKLNTSKPNTLQGMPRSPGMKYRHYAPNAPMTIVSGNAHKTTNHIINELEQEVKNGKVVGVLLMGCTNELCSTQLPKSVKLLNLGETPEEIAQNLFAHLRRFDKLGVEIIFAQMSTEICKTGLGIAIMDRMIKAAEGRVINVG